MIYVFRKRKSIFPPGARHRQQSAFGSAPFRSLGRPANGAPRKCLEYIGW